MQICAYSSTAWDFQHQRSNASNSLTPAVFHCQNVTDHSPCLPHFLLPNAESKSSSRTGEIPHCDVLPCFKFENNTSGRARLWDTELKFLCPGLFMTSPDYLVPAWIGVDPKGKNLGTRLLSAIKTILGLAIIFHQSRPRDFVFS